MTILTVYRDTIDVESQIVFPDVRRVLDVVYEESYHVLK
jgi:hypothetical protein